VSIHHYNVSIDWTGDLGAGTSTYDAYTRDHLIRVQGKPAIEGSSDPAFRGDASRHNPEDLFVSSLASCHMLWYLHLAASNGIVVTAYSDRATGSMDEGQLGKGGRFVEVVLHPVVTIGAGCDAALAKVLHEAAHRACFLANSVNFPVHCEPKIKVASI
jgi:organic hydroperoxide reductase OsmC/OhrA